MKRLLLSLALLTGCADAALEDADLTSSPDGLPTDVAGLAVAALEGGTAVAWVDSLKQLHVRPVGDLEDVVVAQDVSSHTQAGPRLAVSSDGGLVMAYVVERAVEGRRFPASDLEVARSNDGGATWSEPIRPYADAGIPTGHTFHSLAAGPDGTVVVAWLDGTARDQWQQANAETMAHASHRVPTRLVHHGGSHAAEPETEPGTQLMVARSSDGGRTFTSPEMIADHTCQCCRTALEVADDGTVYAVWRHLFPGGVRDIAIARMDDDRWTAPARIHADEWAIDGCPHAGPAITTDADGTVHVAWPTGAESMPGLWHASSTDRGENWTDPAALATPVWGQVRAASPDGRAVFAFEDPATETIGVLTVGASDTLRVDGAGADLASDGTLIWSNGGTVRLRTMTTL